MSSFWINFSSPWFLLLLIPLVLLTFIPYFRLSKKFRRTRNRIVSLVMHLTVVCLSLFVLSGMTFNYTIPNEKNEIMLVVDVSDTQIVSESVRDDFVSTVLRQSRYDSYKVGVVTFGFDSVYAVPLTDDIGSVFDDYKAAAAPDTSATNVADALLYAKSLFKNPDTSKIVLITDGKETDKEAADVIRSVAAGGTRVDVAYIPSSYNESDVAVVGVTLPDYHVAVGEEFNIAVKLAANVEGQVTIELSDNDVPQIASAQTVEFRGGRQSVTLKHKFETSGLHELAFDLTSSSSTIEENDRYISYFYLQVFDKVLMIGRNEEECEPLKTLLTSEKDFEVIFENISESDFFDGVTAEKLRDYDQIILNNIAYSDMPEGFDKELYEYVYSYGGGLLTVGGQDETGGNAHSYVRADMVGTTYQQILPVQAIDYTPPLGVVVIIDRSGSMGTTDNASGRTYLEWATEGAKSCLNAMSERDYIGVVTLDTNEAVVLPLTPRTQEAKILAAIESVNEPTGGTVLPGAIEKAGEMLRSEKNIDKRHIILVTDGIVSEKETYEDIIKQNYANEAASITMSVVLVGSKEGSTPAQDMRAAAEAGHGRLYVVSDTSKLVMLMREDLKVPQITEVNMEKFNPIVYDATSPVFNGVEYGGTDGGLKMKISLDGFYGVKIKKDADLLLTGEYNVPLYAQWKFGRGSVGSFMCDLNGNWSSDFMSDESGVRFIKNVVGTLMPTESIRPKQIETRFSEQNYSNRLDVYVTLNEGETISGRIISASDSGKTERSLNALTTDEEKKLDSSLFVVTPFSSANGFSKCEFVVKRSGVYKIILEKRSVNGEIIATEEFYKSFSYSKEYDIFDEQEETIKEKLLILAERGKGKVIKDLEDPEEIFKSFVTDLSRVFDPRTLFLVTAIVLFLIDVAVRKFKFKWIHELVQDYKEKKNGNKF